MAAWTRWEPGARDRDPKALATWRERLARPVAAQKFLQFAFFEQWRELRAYARARKVRIMGDLPIYVSHDSADVWAHRQYFQLDEQGQPTVVAGVPPDYFSADRPTLGQSDLSLGRACRRRLRLVAGSISRGICRVGHDPPGSFPRI